MIPLITLHSMHCKTLFLRDEELWIHDVFCDERNAYKLCAYIQDSPQYVSVHYRDVCGTLMWHQLCANNITIHNTLHYLHDNVPWPVCIHYCVVIGRISFYCVYCMYCMYYVLYRGDNQIKFSYLMPHTHNGRVIKIEKLK